MAGIGFTLRKVLGKGGIGGSVGAIISGVFIVAGPWIMSLLSMLVIQSAFAEARFGGSGVFQVSVLYCYAVSLSVFSGLHHHFTRIVADLAWEGRHGDATTWMLRFAAIALSASVALGVPIACALRLDDQEALALYRIGLVILFSSINVLWVLVLYVSLLKDYRAIAGAFAAGMTVSVLGALRFSGSSGIGGAVLGYALGVLLIDVVFIAMACRAYPPTTPDDGYAAFAYYAKRYASLILSGFLFYAGQWADKFFFWYARGTEVSGTSLRVYAAYDLPVYLAGLSIIPGLVYFTIITETRLYTDLKHFLFSLNHSSWNKIQAAKRRLILSLRHELRDQSLLQGACSLGIAFMLSRLGLSGKGPEQWLALGAAFSQFTLLTLLVFLYYFELYDRALISAGLFFALNGPIGAVIYAAFPSLPAGLGHLVSGLSSCALAYALLFSSVYRMDRIVFTRALSPERKKPGYRGI